MAQRVSVVLIDDLDGSEASETVAFGIDGTTYEIDLNEGNAAALRESLSAYLTVARKAGRPAGGRKGQSKSHASNGPRDLSKADRDAVRDWSRTTEAATVGIAPLGDRGRVPNAAVAAWQSR